ncbi:sigma54 specific transcriptional regulator, Fis family [Solidesulfovibrio carbinoliphilus subsp. oakridgensis]|uniref:Sigma54 specific transcriptional regulator, Fis family n=1 Tax=Solidesulfovibrio carbinoliphilus subsp. oakridgensis TaxID=694327 RepID=G7QCK5_9BACT|nr:sigma-54-dependent Fis family transcriptional regulator [Solidesulfovibrio carbinoliphilus]EHJ46161.1 sigma54 specific transcriptional regulator, Fis family [Solidesulfovibrio carbinoliphilus subsp. oakridgensis]
MAPQIPDFPKALFEELETEKLQRRFLESLLEFQKVERGSLWIKRPDGYQCIEAKGGQSEQLIGFLVPKDKPSIVGWVIENGRMTIAEPGKDKRHFKEAETDFDVKSTLILCYPLVLKNGDVYGAVEIIDTAHGGSRLNLGREYLELLEEFVAIGSIALGNALAFADQKKETQKLRKLLGGLTGETPLVGKSPAFRTALEAARNYARTDFPVCITGESGTGKELFAREIHRLSARKDKPFLVQNVSAIPETLLESELFGYRKGAFTGADKDKVGLFEAAGGGTVFLDEIGDMALALQSRILRVLQENEVKPLGGTETRAVDVRIISATNRDLTRAIAAGTFREDLFYRLNVLPLALPALRDRPEDIPELLDYFLTRDAARLRIPAKALSAQALRELRQRPFQGNVREMENLVRYLLATVPGEVIEVGDIPPPQGIAARHAAPAACPDPAANTAPDLAAYSWDELERAYALALLERHKWNVTKAARAAGVNRSTFDSRLRKLGISKE